MGGAVLEKSIEFSFLIIPAEYSIPYKYNVTPWRWGIGLSRLFVLFLVLSTKYILNVNVNVNVATRDLLAIRIVA